MVLSKKNGAENSAGVLGLYVFFYSISIQNFSVILSNSVQKRRVCFILVATPYPNEQQNKVLFSAKLIIFYTNSLYVYCVFYSWAILQWRLNVFNTTLKVHCTENRSRPLVAHIPHCHLFVLTQSLYNIFSHAPDLWHL